MKAEVTLEVWRAPWKGNLLKGIENCSSVALKGVKMLAMYAGNIFWKELYIRKLQSWTNCFPYKKWVTKKRIYVSKECSLQNPYLLMVLLSIPSNKLPCFVESLFDGNYNETWNATLNQFDAFVANLSFYLSCFESDKFVGKHIYKYSIVRNKRRP